MANLKKVGPCILIPKLLLAESIISLVGSWDNTLMEITRCNICISEVLRMVLLPCLLLSKRALMVATTNG
jgi:hypothetical protein